MLTVENLILAYKASRHWNDLKPNSQRSYSYLLASLNCLQEQAASFCTVSADRLYDSLSFTFGSYKAHHTIKVLRRVWQFALRRGYVQSNPFLKMGLKGLEARTTAWTDVQMESYQTAAETLQRPSMGLLALLCYDLCQRPGDMRKLVWGNYQNGFMSFVQEKTGTELIIPVSNRVRARLIPAKEYVPIVRSETTGKGYDERSLAMVHRRIARAAGLPDELQLRDLRRSGATLMGEMGCSEDEIRAVTGHKSRQVLNTYVVASQRMASNAMERRFGQL